jgi:hypothetical protein
VVETAPGQLGDVAAPAFADQGCAVPRHFPRQILRLDLDSEGQGVRVVAGDEDRPDGQVLARHEAEEVDERDLSLAGQPEGDVVSGAVDRCLGSGRSGARPG